MNETNRFDEQYLRTIPEEYAPSGFVCGGIADG